MVKVLLNSIFAEFLHSHAALLHVPVYASDALSSEPQPRREGSHIQTVNFVTGERRSSVHGAEGKKMWKRNIENASVDSRIVYVYFTVFKFNYSFLQHFISENPVRLTSHLIGKKWDGQPPGHMAD
jgi:hypothetical protein